MDEESQKLIQSYHQSLKAANDLSVSLSLSFTHIRTLYLESFPIFLLHTDLTKSDSTLHKNLRGPGSVMTHCLEISSGLHMSS